MLFDSEDWNNEVEEEDDSLIERLIGGRENIKKILASVEEALKYK